MGFEGAGRKSLTKVGRCPTLALALSPIHSNWDQIMLLAFISLLLQTQDQLPQQAMVAKTFTVPAGTRVRVLQTEPLKAGISKRDMPFDLHLLDDIKDSTGSFVIVPKGSRITGKVLRSDKSYVRFPKGTVKGKLVFRLSKIEVADKKWAKIELIPGDLVNGSGEFSTFESIGMSPPSEDDFQNYYSTSKAQDLAAMLEKIKGKATEPASLAEYIAKWDELKSMVCIFYKDLEGESLASLIRTDRIASLNDLVAEYKRAGSLSAFFGKATLGTLMTALVFAESLYQIYRDIKKYMERLNPAVMPGAVFDAKIIESADVQVQVSALNTAPMIEDTIPLTNLTQHGNGGRNVTVSGFQPLSDRITLLEKAKPKLAQKLYVVSSNLRTNRTHRSNNAYALHVWRELVAKKNAPKVPLRRLPW